MESNVQKTRNEIVQIRHLAKLALNVMCVGNDNSHQLYDIVEKCETILALPLRQCDVGTAEEQDARFRQSADAPYHTLTLANALAWAQTPYEAQEGGAE